MGVLVCPHCGNHRIVHARVPKDVVVVLPCPSCHELVVLFRNKIIALNRDVIEHGTFEEKKLHIAGIIAEFLEPGMFPALSGETRAETDNAAEEAAPSSKASAAAPEASPIQQSDVDRFVSFDLKQIDQAAYFRKYIG